MIIVGGAYLLADFACANRKKKYISMSTFFNMTTPNFRHRIAPPTTKIAINAPF